MSVFWALPADSPPPAGLLMELWEPWLQPLLGASYSHPPAKPPMSLRSSRDTAFAPPPASPSPLRKDAGATRFMTDAVQSSKMHLDVFGIRRRKAEGGSQPSGPAPAALLSRPSLHHSFRLRRYTALLLSAPASSFPSLWYQRHSIPPPPWVHLRRLI